MEWKCYMESILKGSNFYVVYLLYSEIWLIIHWEYFITVVLLVYWIPTRDALICTQKALANSSSVLSVTNHF